MRIELTESFYSSREVIIRTDNDDEDEWIVIEVGYAGGNRYEARLDRKDALALSLAIKAALAEIAKAE